MKRSFDMPLVIGVGLVVTLLIVNAALTYRNIRQLGEDTDWVAHTHEVLNQTSDVLIAMVDAEMGQRGFLITGKSEFLQPYDAALARSSNLISKLKEKTKDNAGQQARIQRLEELIAVRWVNLKQGIELRRENAEAAAAFIASGEGKAQMAAIRIHIAGMEAVENGMLKERQSRSANSYRSAVTAGVITALIGLVTVAAFVVLLNRSLRARWKAAATIHEQREFWRTTLTSIGDAVIATNEEGKVVFLNAVAQSLTGWTLDDARGEPLETVFNIVNEQSRKPVENPVVKVLKFGQIVGLANHTILIGKNGAEKAIDDTAAPIRKETGELAGVVLVFHDITERRNIERSLADKNRLTALRADISNALALDQDLRPALQQCTEALVRHLDVAFARLWTLNETESVLELQASAGLYTHLDGPHGRVAVGEFKIGRIAKNRRPLLTNDVSHDPNISDPTWADREGMVAFAGYPLLVGGQVMGVLAMFARAPFSESVLGDLWPIADGIAQVVNRKWAEEAVRQSEARKSAILLSSLDAIITMDHEGNIVDFNPAAEQTFGYARDQAIGKPMDEMIIPPPYREKHRRGLAHFLATGEGPILGKRLELPARRADASEFLAELTIVRMPSDGPPMFTGFFRDIGERKNAEEEKRQSAERFKNLAESIPQLAWMAHPDGHIYWYNKRWYDYTDTTLEQMDGWGWQSVHDPKMLPKVMDRWKESISTGKPFDMVFPLRGKDGVFRSFLTRVMPLANDNGKIIQWFGTNTDISDQKRIEDEIRRNEKFLLFQKQALEMIVEGSALRDVLNALARAMEDQAERTILVTIHLLNERGTHFESTVAPSLPPTYRLATEGLDVQTKLGPSSQAVISGTSVVIPNISADPKWKRFADLVEPMGVHSAFSTPIFSAERKVLGTFAIYYSQPGTPSIQETQVVELLSRTVALAIERARSEELLRESDERFRIMADSIPQLAWIADVNTDGKVNWFNERWLSYTGTTTEQMKGSGWKSVHHPDYVDRVAAKFEHHVREGLDWEDTFPLRGKDGQYRWFLSRMKVIRNESGKVLRLFGTNTDITEQQRMADELRQNAADMSEADRRKNEFLAMLAHELRNPLAPIRNAVQALRLTVANRAEKTPVEEAVHSTSEMMERQIGQMVRLVDDLLDVSRISRGKIVLQMGRIELAAAVHHAVEAARPQFENMNQELTVTLPPRPIYLNADPTRLAQVVGNLLNNACKFTDRGGRIWLTVELASGGRKPPDAAVETPSAIHSSSAMPSGGLRPPLASEAKIRIRDTGVGIAADHLPHIFEMFMQIDTSLGRSVSGLGIGLSLVKNLAEMHGGTVEVHSEGLGRGSEFVVRLPLWNDESERVKGKSEADPVDPPVADRHPSKLRILVVDDNRDSADSLAMLMKLIGNETHVAYDGLEAMQAAATLKPDVVLLDIGLPKLSGHEVARNIRDQPWGKDIVLVALTGWGQDEDRQKSKDAGFNDHMVKPVDYAAIAKLLAELRAAKV